MPVIKAIITTLDNLPNLQETVPVLRSEPLDEIVVVNNGSVDGTQEWLTTQLDLTVVNRDNLGAGPGRNAGLDAAGEFDYVLMLDGGIRPLHNGVLRMLEYLDKTPECHAIAPDWHTLETDKEKAWRRWPHQITNTYRNTALSLTHYCLSRAAAWDGIRFAEHGPFGQPGWGCDDDELAHRWNEAGVVVHAVEGIKVYRRASGSFARLFRETGIWPTQHGSVYEQRIVWLQQNQPQHGKGNQWGEPWLTIVIKVSDVDTAARLIKSAHEQVRLRRYASPWENYPHPYSVVAWSGSDEFTAWAEPRRMCQCYGDTIIVNGEITRRTPDNEATWAGDFRIFNGDKWQDAIRSNAHYYGLIANQDELDALITCYNTAYPYQLAEAAPEVTRWQLK